MNKPIGEFLLSAKPEYRAIVERLDAAIAESDCNLDLAIKWGQLTYTKNSDFHHWICAIKVTKNFVGLTFHFGGLLDDPDGVFMVGTSKFARKIEYRHVDDVDAAVIQKFIRLALDKLETFKANWREIQKCE